MSSLHGIPILIKDNTATDLLLGMETTIKSLAFNGPVTPRNTVIVDKHIAAGAIVIGKASLSEWSYLKGNGIHCEWSALAGQGQSSYVRGGFQDDDTPRGHSTLEGSSSGSAISITTSFTPLIVRTETIGSPD